MESINNPLGWYTICGGARTYIDRFMALHAPTSVFLKSPVTRLERMPGGTVSLATDCHPKQTYGHVILTTSAEIALRILYGAATDMEEQILRHFKTCTNTVYLHSDLSQMPQRRSAWSGWNYLASKASANLQASGPTGSWTYTHPVYSIDAIKAQQRIPDIQGVHGVSFAGAWTKKGFHEDGFTSGIQAAVHMLQQTGSAGGPESCYVSNHERALPSKRGRLSRYARFVFRHLLPGYPD
nr:hypothetical protein CFP56_46783 [Quercus suber]